VRHVARVLILAAFVILGSIALAPLASTGQEEATGAGAAAAGATSVGAAAGVGTFAFLSTDDAGHALRFDPCHPVSYVINPDGAPVGAADDVHEAFRRLGAATGMTFTYAGTTSEVHRVIDGSSGRRSYQPERYGRGWAPVLVSFVTGDREPVLAGNVLGYGGSTSYWSSSSDPAYVTGEIVLDRDLSLVQPGFGPGMTRGNLIQHELAHVIGLDHVEDRRELMYESISEDSPDGYGPGDRAGLARLGAAAGCLDIARPS
jgi:hypothetical protein